MFYITRICHNTSNWQHPTGSAIAEKGTFFSKHRYGHEEWLFRFEWQVGGWQYGFLQGLNDQRSSLLANGVRTADVVLFENPQPGLRRYVARIRHIEILDDAQAANILAEYKRRGWHDCMLREIDQVGGDRGAFGDAAWAPHVLNMRFRLEDIDWYPLNTLARQGDPVLQYKRYTFIRLSTDAHFPSTINGRRKRNGQHAPPIQDAYFRGGGSPKECSPEHGRIVQALYEELKKEYPLESIVFEENFVDVIVKTETETIFFEIKSDLDARRVIRLALGQLLEYAYYWDALPSAGVKLIAVGRIELTADDKRYVAYLAERFRLPFSYRQVKLPSSTSNG